MKDDRKAALAIFLSILVIFTYTNLFMAPPPPAPVQENNVQENVEQGTQNTTQSTHSQTQFTNGSQVTQTFQQDNTKTYIPSAKDVEDSKTYKVETNLFVAEITNLGGRLKSFQLKKYRDKAGTTELLDLVFAEGTKLPLGVYTSGQNDAGVNYKLLSATSGVPFKDSNFLLTDAESLTLVFEGQLPNGNLIKKIFEFQPSTYLFKVKARLANPTLDESKIWLEWTENVTAISEESNFNIRSFKYLDKEESLTTETIIKPEDTYPEALVHWVSIGDNYFSANFIANEKLSLARVTSDLYLDQKYVNVKASGTNQELDLNVFLGPKEPELLKQLPYNMFRSIDLGWFAFVGQPILVLIKFFYNILGNYGLSIVLVTLIIKILLLPLTKTSFKSMKALQEIQPEIQALRKRVTDQAVLQQEMIALYKRKGVNPMGGCLPMLLQIPVFLGMYNALGSSIYLRHADFALWINDLSAPEKLMILGIPVPVMILIMGASMFLQTLTTPHTGDANQRKIMLFMPIVFTGMFIIYPFPSGLVLYWLINNIISVVQQYTLRSEANISPMKTTIASSIVVYALAYLLTLL